ncbi:uncharacterized protein LOC131930445 [Physella acuta]|uniref:uncharacterized protein LOC131930445 n=1 Tax=Physella acuta TaxID=109671 RepID=UPI0027DE07A7|nr:uncharacterized protein LOC131930445 [Physella acuta]
MPPKRDNKPRNSFLNFDALILFCTFICANGVAFAIRQDMAVLMATPTIFVMHQVGLIGKKTVVLVFAIGLAWLAYLQTESFYILAVHSIFYLGILLITQEISITFI